MKRLLTLEFVVDIPDGMDDESLKAISLAKEQVLARFEADPQDAIDSGFSGQYLAGIFGARD